MPGSSKSNRGRVLRVLFFSIHHLLGGGENSLLYLLKGMQGLIDATVVVKRRGTFATLLKKSGIKTITGNYFVSYRKFWYLNPSRSYRFFRTLSLLKRLNPDLVHANTLEASFPVAVAAKFLHIPVVVTIRGPWEIKRESQLETLLKYASAVVFTTEKMREIGVSLNIEGKVIPLGIELERFKRAGRKEDSEGVVIGCLGRLSPEKGQHLLLETLKMLIEEGIKDVKVIFMGGGDFSQDVDYAVELRNRVDELGLSSLVEFRDFSYNVEDFYSNVDLIVVPSLYEMPSRVIQEAMASGLPVIATDGGATSELIDDGKDGLLFKSGNVEDLKEKLKKLILSPSLRKRLGEEALKKSGRFDIRFSVEKMMELYRELLK